MTATNISPNELAEYYDSIFAVLNQVPSDSHPAWEFALESALFGGEGLADNAKPYGEQQSERNSFKIAEYREQFGNGDTVTDFSAIDEAAPRAEDRQYLDDLCMPPKSPETGRVLPIFVGENELEEAMSILDEFPAEPAAESPGDGVDELLDPGRFPGLSADEPEDNSHTDADENPHGSGSEPVDLPPTEVADLYEIFRVLVDEIPEESHPRWKEAIESIALGGDLLHDRGIAYGKQQATRNEFKIGKYREAYGDGSRVKEFPTLETETVSIESGPSKGRTVTVPVAPKSGTALPLSVDEEGLEEALGLLTEFPAEPAAEGEKKGLDYLFDEDLIPTETESGVKNQNPDSAGHRESGVESDEETSPVSDAEETAEDSAGQTVDKHASESPRADLDASQSNSDDGKGGVGNQPDLPETQSNETATDAGSNAGAKTGQGSSIEQSPNAADTESSETDDSTVLREEGAGEVSKADVGNGSEDELSSILDDLDDSDRKHDDPKAEYAHRKAQQRDPRDVVELGETISLVVTEADFTSGSPTVLGTKNSLVIFVTDPPRHLSKYDTIRAKIVDFGGNDNSAIAAFLGYAD